MKTFALLLAATLFWTGNAAAESDIDELAVLIEGTFDSLLANPDQPLEDRLVDRKIRVDNTALGDVVFYQQIKHREELSVYRQRILVLEESEGAILQHAYVIKDAKKFVDADVAAFATLGPDDIENFMPAGCVQTWTKTDGGFKGYVDPQQCEIISSRTGEPRQIEAETLLTRDYETMAERGYDGKTGERLFGTEPGESYRLDRVGTD